MRLIKMRIAKVKKENKKEINNRRKKENQF